MLSSLGTRTRALSPSWITTVVVPLIPSPYEMSPNCSPKSGEKSLAMLDPLLWTNARYSPLEPSLKLVCSSLPAMARSLLDANTTRYSSAATDTLGNCHLERSVASSVRYQPLRLKVLAVGL